MNEVTPIGRIHPSLARIAARRAADAEAKVTQTRRGDSVELSNTAKLLSQAQQLPDVRQELVDRVRSEIEAGNYLTDEKLDAALDGLLNDLTE